MPGHFTHIYTARRVADLLAQGSFLDGVDGAAGFGVHVGDSQGEFTPEHCAELMVRWEHFTALGAIGPDIFFFSQDYTKTIPGTKIPVPSDELMLALSIFYFYDMAKDAEWEPLLVILAEVDQAWARLVRFLVKLAKLWSDLVAAWDATIGKVFGAVETAIDDLTGGVLEALQQAISEAAKALVAFGAEEVLTFTDLLGFFSLNERNGWDEQDFLWSDMTHYRRTTRLAANLMQQAFEVRGSGAEDAEARFEQFFAFVMGWLCHVGTDTVAHSFVNEQAGGPFRTHWQRHHLVENHMDAWNYRQAGPGGSLPTDPWAATPTYPDVGSSALVFAVSLSPDAPQGQDRPPTLPEDRTEAAKKVDVDGEMPAWLADGIVAALVATYADTDHPQVYGGQPFQDALHTDQSVLTRVVELITGAGLDRPFADLLAAVAPDSAVKPPPGFPLPWQVATTYRFMISFYKLMFWSSWDLRKPKKPDVVITPPASDFTDLASAPDFSGPSSGDPVEDFCDAVRSFFDWAAKELEAAATLVGDVIKMLGSPGTYPVRLALWQAAMWAWDVVANTHEILAHTGLITPHGETSWPDGELALGDEIDRGLITLGHTVDAAFAQALADNLDVFGNLDHDTSLLEQVRNPHDERYPWLPQRPTQAAGQTPNEFHRPWTYPDTRRDAAGAVVNNSLELPTTFAGPYPLGALPSDVLFRTGRPVSQRERSDYETSPTPAQTDSYSREFIGSDPIADHSPLGDPVPFSAYLIGRTLAGGYDVNFNLDADRGYGYRCWDWDRTSGATDTTPNGKTYRVPDTWPEGAPGWPGPAEVLGLHYLDQPDGGLG